MFHVRGIHVHFSISHRDTSATKVGKIDIRLGYVAIAICQLNFSAMNINPFGILSGISVILFSVSVIYLNGAVFSSIKSETFLQYSSDMNSICTALSI